VLLGGEEIVLDQAPDAGSPAVFASTWLFDAHQWKWVAKDLLPPMRTGRTALGVCVAPGYPRGFRYFAERRKPMVRKVPSPIGLPGLGATRMSLLRPRDPSLRFPA